MNDDDSPPPVRAFIDGADPPQEPPSNQLVMASGIPSGNSTSETPNRRAGLELPPGCPITPLGKDQGVRWFLDGNRQLRGIEGARLTRLQILDLLGTAAAYAEEIFGTETRSGTLRFDSARAEQMLLAATAKRIWSPAGRVWGRGFWADPNGKLIVHAGTCLLIDGECREPGIFGDQVYPAGLELTPPQPPADPRDPFAAGREVLALFERWKWRAARSIEDWRWAPLLV